MAKPRHKPEESLNRSPGRSRFSIPPKETPQIDGSYLDKLFADFQQQSAEQEKQNPTDVVVPANETPRIKKSIISAPPPPTDPTDIIHEEKSSSAELKPASIPSSASTSSRSANVVVPERQLSQRQPRVSNNIQLTEKASLVADRSDISLAALQDHGDEELLSKVARKFRLAAGEISVVRAMIRLCRECAADTCYIKIPQLMADTGLSDRHAQRILKNLHALELIEKLAEYSNLDRLGTRYRLKLR